MSDKMFEYTEPKKNFKGMWEVTVIREDGWTDRIVTRTTKKDINEWIKEHKRENS